MMKSLFIIRMQIQRSN